MQVFSRAKPPAHRRAGDDRHSQRHGSAMGNGEVCQLFDAVANGVPQVQQLAAAGFPLIGGDNVPLGGNAGGNDLLGLFRHRRA